MNYQQLWLAAPARDRIAACAAYRAATGASLYEFAGLSAEQRCGWLPTAGKVVPIRVER